tara:strand:+ start:13915 stop:14580 length:666 start_codon:yes stop_codon:yes gene_type:complete
MTFSPTRHHLPSALVAADQPLSGDVMGRSVESIDYLWQVTTNSADGRGTALSAPQGHTHDGVRDQTLTADAFILTDYPTGFGAPFLRSDSSSAPSSLLPHYAPNGGWADGSGTLTPIRSFIFAPFAAAPAAVGSNATLRSQVLIEKGATLSAAAAVTVTVTIDGTAIVANSANAAAGLETIQIGDWAATSLTSGGPLEMLVQISVPSGDFVRVWHSLVYSV